MSHTIVANKLISAIDHVTNRISEFVYFPEKNFTRTGKLPPKKLFSFLISQGSSSTKNELIEAFDFAADHPSLPALIQQRAKLKPAALSEVFYDFNRSMDELHPNNEFRFLAVDGSTLTYQSNSRFSDEKFFTTQGNSEKGCYSIHAIASYDLMTNSYSDCVLQPIREKDEYKAFSTIADRHPLSAQASLVFIADRGFCSYNNMAHVIARKQFFLFRAKDITSKGLLHNLDLPNSVPFDVDVTNVIIRKYSKSRSLPDGVVRYVGKQTAFDYLPYGSPEYYVLNFRAVRFEVTPGNFVALVTNLPRDKFSVDALKEQYHLRWNEETSFRLLKYSIGLTKFHSAKADFVMQEIWARLIAYNFTNAVVNCAVIENAPENKHIYKVNFSCAVKICRQFFRSSLKDDSIDVILLLLRELVPIRPNRSFLRLNTAHFRRPAYFLYRAS